MLHLVLCSELDIWGHSKVKITTVSNFEKWQLLPIGI